MTFKEYKETCKEAGNFSIKFTKPDNSNLQGLYHL